GEGGAVGGGTRPFTRSRCGLPGRHGQREEGDRKDTRQEGEPMKDDHCEDIWEMWQDTGGGGETGRGDRTGGTPPAGGISAPPARRFFGKGLPPRVSRLRRGEGGGPACYADGGRA